VGHPVIARVYEKAPHPPDLTIDGMDTVPGPYLVFTQQNNVFDDCAPPVFWQGAEVDEFAAKGADGRVCLAGDSVGQVVADQAATANESRVFGQLTLLRGVECVELGARAAQRDSPDGSLHKVNGDKPPGIPPVPRLDDKVGDRVRGRVNDYAANLPAGTIGAARPGPDREFPLRCHCCPLFGAVIVRGLRRDSNQDATALGAKLHISPPAHMHMERSLRPPTASRPYARSPPSSREPRPMTAAARHPRGTSEAFASRLFGAHVTVTSALESLMIASFVRGLPVRDVEATLADALGDQAAVSKSTVSAICQQIRPI
jgi:hypothetical protein